MPVPIKEFEQEIEVLHKIFELPDDSVNQNGILFYLVINYLEKELEEKLKENPELSINYLPVLMVLIQKFSIVDKKLPYNLKNILGDILNSYKNTSEAEEWQTEIEETLDTLDILGVQGYDFIQVI